MVSTYMACQAGPHLLPLDQVEAQPVLEPGFGGLKLHASLLVQRQLLLQLRHLQHETTRSAHMAAILLVPLRLSGASSGYRQENGDIMFRAQRGCQENCETMSRV